MTSLARLPSLMIPPRACRTSPRSGGWAKPTQGGIGSGDDRASVGDFVAIEAAGIPCGDALACASAIVRCFSASTAARFRSRSPLSRRSPAAHLLVVERRTSIRRIRILQCTLRSNRRQRVRCPLLRCCCLPLLPHSDDHMWLVQSPCLGLWEFPRAWRVVGISPYEATSRRRLPSGGSRLFASHRRAAFSPTACSTGAISVGEFEMMRRTSEVAVCSSSASTSLRTWAISRLCLAAVRDRRGKGEFDRRGFSPSLRSNEACDRAFGSSPLCETRSSQSAQGWPPMLVAVAGGVSSAERIARRPERVSARSSSAS